MERVLRGGGRRYNIFSISIDLTQWSAKNESCFVHFLATPPPPLGVRLAYEWQYHIGSVQTSSTRAHLTLYENLNISICTKNL